MDIKLFNLFFLSLLYLFILKIHTACVHSEFSKNASKLFLNDLTDHRLLAENTIGRLRIYADYSQLKNGSSSDINLMKRATNITANYFYNVLNVTRLPRLYYPSNVSLTCNTLTIPKKYVTEGVIGDLGIIVGDQANKDAIYIAKSLTCAFLQSNKRPIWGILIWNNVYLKYDQVGFQQMMYVGIHELTHILGFSAAMYQLYPKGNPLVNAASGDNFLNSTRIQQEIKSFFGCNNSKGMPLEDQDGTLIASHWERKAIGVELMIASEKVGAYMSRFTLALLQSSGWYLNVSYKYAEPSLWGKGKGCSFLNIDNCEGTQFCQDSSFSCIWEGTAIGKCGTDPFTGTCMVSKYFTNTICTDESFQLKNLNAQMNALQRGGSSSRCFDSSFRQTGVVATKLNQRCYISTCSATGQYIYIMMGSYVLICRSPKQILTPPPGMQGNLTCPKNFDNICKNKKTCPYHCNKNGACIDGKCLCTGATELTMTCIDISIILSPVGLTGGLLNALIDNNNNGLNLTSQTGSPGSSNQAYNYKLREVKQYSVNSKCIQGTIYDNIFGQCLKCKDVFNCENCNEDGCVTCDNGRLPINRSC